MNKPQRSMLSGLLLSVTLLTAVVTSLWLVAVPQDISAQDSGARPTRAPKCRLVIVTGKSNFGKSHSNPMVFSGTVGRTDFGPAHPEGGAFTAANINGDAPCRWSAEANRPWLSIGKSRGTVAADDADEGIQIFINDRVREIQKTGTYDGIIKFDAPEGFTRTLHIRLDVLASCRFNNDTRILTYEMDEGGDTGALERKLISIRNEEYSGDCEWVASSDQPWVYISPTQGKLKAGVSMEVEVTVTNGIVAYGSGNHNANVQFDGQLFQPSATSIRMNVIPPPCNLQIDQGDAVVQSSGIIGGPFTPSSVRLTLRNNGGDECRWSALPKETWANITPLSGIIPKGAVSALEVTINEGANTLPPGSYVGLVTLSTGAQESDRTVQVNLNVVPLPCEFKVNNNNPLDFNVDSNGNVNNKHTIELSNPPHRQDCLWATNANPDWLIITPSEGVIPAGDNPRVEVSIDEAKLISLPRKPTHEGTVQFYAQGLESAMIDVILEVDCLENQPCIDLHSSRENILFGENAELSLSMSNPLSRSEVTVNLVLTIPDGWSLAPGDYNADCNGGKCSIKQLIPPGEKDDIHILASPNAPSSEERKSTFVGRVEWFDATPEESTVYEVAFPITVAPASEQIIADFRKPDAPAPTLPVQAAPAAAQTAPATGQTPPGQVVPTGFWANNNFLTLVVAGVVIILLLTFCFLILKALRGVNKVVQNQNTILEGQSRPSVAPSHYQQLPPVDDP